jgi:branched-chain amino acid transport system substrate-binding protein
MKASVRSWLFLIPILFLAGCGGGSGERVWVGHLSPLSGADKKIGESSRHGVLLAVEEANEDPDTKGAGRHVEVRHADTRGDPATFGAEATRLVAVNKVFALLGGSSSAEIEAIKQIDRPGLLISPAGLADDAQRGPGLFFTGLSPAQQGGALARLAVREKLGRVIVLVNEDTQGHYRALAEAFLHTHREDWANKHPIMQSTLSGPRLFGKEISIAERAQALAKEVSTGTRLDAIFVAGKGSDVVKLRAAMGAAKTPVLFAGNEGSLRELLQEPATRDGVYLATAFAADADAGAVQSFVARFKKRFDGREPDVHAALAYDSARILFRALRRSSHLSLDEIQKELSEMSELAALTGPLTFDKNGQARRTAFVARIDGGKPKTVGSFRD